MSLARLIVLVIQETIKRNEDDAIDYVYEHLSRHLAEGRSELIDEILDGADVEKLTPAIIGSMLTVTSGARLVLKKRVTFYRRSFARLKKDVGVDRTRRILSGLVRVRWEAGGVAKAMDEKTEERPAEWYWATLDKPFQGEFDIVHLSCTCLLVDGIVVRGSSCPIHGLPTAEWDSLQ